MKDSATMHRGTMGRTMAALTTAFLMTLVSIPGCLESARPIGIRLKKVSQFDDEMKRYLKFKEHKAIAVAGDVQGLYAMGFSYNVSSLAIAIQEAFEDCEARRADRRIEATCQLYAFDDQVMEIDTSELDVSE